MGIQLPGEQMVPIKLIVFLIQQGIKAINKAIVGIKTLGTYPLTIIFIALFYPLKMNDLLIRKCLQARISMSSANA